MELLIWFNQRIRESLEGAIGNSGTVGVGGIPTSETDEGGSEGVRGQEEGQEATVRDRKQRFCDSEGLMERVGSTHEAYTRKKANVVNSRRALASCDGRGWQRGTSHLWQELRIGMGWEG